MTGYTVHTGSSIKFSEGWDRIFSGKKQKSKPPAKDKQSAPKSSKSAKRGE